MYKVVQVTVKPNYTLGLKFNDGLEGDVCLSDRLFGPVFEPLKDPEFFAQVTIDRFGIPTWPNRADLDPDALHDKVAMGERHS